jgi:hypothetical protein
VADPLTGLIELPDVVAAVQRARTAVDRLLGNRLLSRHSTAVAAESVLRGARASAALDGVAVDLSRVRTGATDDPSVRGALRASSECGRLAGTWRRAPRQVLARLHALAAADAVGPEKLGRPRADRLVRDPLELGEPPSPAEVGARLDALCALLSADSSRNASPGGTEIPALVMAAIAHGELLALRPFGWGDGIVARAAQRLTLTAWGLDAKGVVPAEVGHLELGGTYEEALRAYLDGTPEGVAAWIDHCATAVTLGAREAMAICVAIAGR